MTQAGQAAEKKHSLMLIDGHSMAFRAYYALPPSLTTPAGEPIQAVYGFLGMLFRLLEDLKPRWLCVTFDEGRPFRHEIYDLYKAGREDIPDDIGDQVTHLRRILSVMNVNQVAGAPYEADDYIATLTRMALESDPDLDVTVVSGDRDLFQIASERSGVLYPIKGIKEHDIYDAKKVVERFGVTPLQLKDFKAMVGDPSDNIPGVKGIGEKGAAKLLQAHDDLEGVYANLDEFTPSIKSKLEAGEEMAYLSRRLVTLKEDIELELDLDAMEARFEREPVSEIMREYGFNSTIKRMPEAYTEG